MQTRPNTSFESLSLKEFFRARKISTMGWIIFWVEVVSMMVMLVIFVAPGWGWTHEIRGQDQFDAEVHGYYGVWYVCWRLRGEDGRPYGPLSCDLLEDHFMPSWLKAVQAMFIMAFLSAVASMTLASVYVCSKHFNKNHSIVTGVSFSAGATSLLMIIVFVVWCAKFLHDAKWCCGSGVIQVVSWRLWYCFIMACAMPAFYGALCISAVTELQALKRDTRKRWEYQQRLARQQAEFYQYQQMTEREQRMWKQQYRPY